MVAMECESGGSFNFWINDALLITITSLKINIGSFSRVPRSQTTPLDMQKRP